MIGGGSEATGTPRSAGGWSVGATLGADVQELVDVAIAPAREPGTIDVTRFAHASEAEMARILDFYAVRWEYEPTTFPILWNLDGEVIESFAPDFYLPELELFLEMTTLRQRLVRKKNRKLRRMRELYPDIRIKLFYARDFRAMMLKYGRLALAEALSGTPGQMTPERVAPVDAVTVIATIESEPAALLSGSPAGAIATSPAPRTRPGRRRRRRGLATQAGAEREASA